MRKRGSRSSLAAPRSHKSRGVADEVHPSDAEHLGAAPRAYRRISQLDKTLAGSVSRDAIRPTLLMLGTIAAVVTPAMLARAFTPDSPHGSVRAHPTIP